MNNIGSDNRLFSTSVLGGPVTGGQFTVSGTPFRYDPSMGNLLLNIAISGFGPDGRVFLDQRDTLGPFTTSRAYNGILGQADNGALVTQFEFRLTPPSRVPIPSTLPLIGLGMIALGAMLWKRQPPSQDAKS